MLIHLRRPINSEGTFVLKVPGNQCAYFGTGHRPNYRGTTAGKKLGKSPIGTAGRGFAPGISRYEWFFSPKYLVHA